MFVVICYGSCRKLTAIDADVSLSQMCVLFLNIPVGTVVTLNQLYKIRFSGEIGPLEIGLTL